MLSASTLRPVFSVFLLQEETVIAAAAMTAAVRINLFIVLNVEIQKSYKDTQSLFFSKCGYLRFTLHFIKNLSREAIVSFILTKTYSSVLGVL